MPLMPGINYAEQYTTEMQAQYPFMLHFGELYNAPDNSKYRFIDGNTIEMPTITTSGRTDSDRSGKYTQGTYSNNWVKRTLSNERQWNIPLHLRDVEETNGSTALDKLIKDHVEQHVYPEMDAYTGSKIFYEWNITNGHAPVTTALTTANILEVIDDMMIDLDNARVPVTGRILYVTHEVKKLIKNAESIQRTLDVQTSADVINRNVSRLDELTVKTVPALLMKTEYDFTMGYKATATAKQINMMLIHPSAVITPNTYNFAGYSEPTPASFGIGTYFEESHEDVFIMPFKDVAIQFHTEVLTTPETPTE